MAMLGRVESTWLRSMSIDVGELACSTEPFRVRGLVIFCSEDRNVEVAAAAGAQALVQQTWGKSCHLLDGTIVLSPDL